MNERNFSSFDIEMVQPRFVGAEKQSVRAQQAAAAYDARAAARVAIQTSMSQSVSKFSSHEVELSDIIEVLTVFNGVMPVLRALVFGLALCFGREY